MKKYEALQRKIKRLQRRQFDTTFLEGTMPPLAAGYARAQAMLARPAVAAVARRIEEYFKTQRSEQFAPLREYNRQQKVMRSVVQAMIDQGVTHDALAVMSSPDRHRLVSSLDVALKDTVPTTAEEVATVLEALLET